MPNRNLNSDEFKKAAALLEEIRHKLEALAGDNPGLLFAYRRKMWKELQFDERGKPGQRKLLKARKMGEQGGKCALCPKTLPEKYAVLDRLDGMDGYTVGNTRLLCPDCDRRVQEERGYR